MDFNTILEFLKNKPEFGYFLLGVLVGIWLFKFFLRKMTTIITMFVIGLLSTSGFYTLYHNFMNESKNGFKQENQLIKQNEEENKIKKEMMNKFVTEILK